MNFIQKMINKFRHLKYLKHLPIFIYRESPEALASKIDLYDDFNQRKEKLYAQYQNDQQLKVINKKRRWNLEISSIEHKMKTLNPHEYEMNKKDFDQCSPIYNGDVSNFYGKEVKMKRVFYNKRKNII